VPAYNFSRPRIDATGGQLSLPSLRGKVVVVNFWQSYCEPCHTEARTLEAVSNQWKGKDVVFLGIDEIDLVSAAHAFMKRYGVTYPTVSDDGPLVGHWGVTGYPETFIVDRTGSVVPPHFYGPVSKVNLNAAIRHALKT